MSETVAFNPVHQEPIKGVNNYEMIPPYPVLSHTPLDSSQIQRSHGVPQYFVGTNIISNYYGIHPVPFFNPQQINSNPEGVLLKPNFSNIQSIDAQSQNPQKSLKELEKVLKYSLGNEGQGSTESSTKTYDDHDKVNEQKIIHASEDSDRAMLINGTEKRPNVLITEIHFTTRKGKENCTHHLLEAEGQRVHHYWCARNSTELESLKSKGRWPETGSNFRLYQLDIPLRIYRDLSEELSKDEFLKELDKIDKNVKDTGGFNIYPD